MDYETAKEILEGSIERIQEATDDLKKGLIELKASRAEGFKALEGIETELRVIDGRIESAAGWRDKVLAFCRQVDKALGPIDIDEPLEIHDLRLAAGDLVAEAPGLDKSDWTEDTLATIREAMGSDT